LKEIAFSLMTQPSEFSKDSEQILQGLRFELTESYDHGMHKSFEWKNETMILGLVYDRGYYECYVLPHKKPFENLDLIRLLRFINGDPKFYEKELIAANLSYCLPINDYITLFNKSYDLINNFFLGYTPETFERYKRYEFQYNGL
jgi:hypothetical protein